MTRFRALIALAIVVLGLTVASGCMIKLHWLGACGTVVSSVAVAASALFWRDSPVEFKLVATAGWIFGIGAVFAEHVFFNMDRTKAHADFAYAFIQMPILCSNLTPPQRAVQFDGMRVCTQQGGSQASAVAELAKAEYLPPLMALLDQAHSVFSGGDEDACERAAEVGRTVCPAAFDAVDSVPAAQRK